MSKILNQGWIYRFRYSGINSNNPNPMALILYADKHYTHAITLDVLSPALTNQLIEFIAMMATKKIRSKNAFDLYHLYLKYTLPKIIKIAYRTYITENIRKSEPISAGYFTVKKFLYQLKKNFSDKEYKDVFKTIKSSIKVARVETKQKRRQQLFSLFRKDEQVTAKELHKRTSEYVNKINEIVAACIC